MPTPTRAYLGLGSNLGDREALLRQAIQRLRAHGEVAAVSGIYESPALLPKDAPTSWDIPYLNQVLALDSTLDADELLQAIQQIEADLGRKRHARWAPRSMDIDILLYGNKAVASEAITIPHPHMHLRDFVLLPLAEIAPQLTLHNRAIGEWIEALPKISAQPYRPQQRAHA